MRGYRRVELLTFRLRHSADFAGRDLDVLGLDRADDVAWHQLVALKLIRIDPDPHRILRSEDVDVSDARNSRQIVLDVTREPVGDVDVRGLVSRIVNADDHEKVGGSLGNRNALLLHLLREASDRRLNLVLNLDLGDVRIDALVENGRDADLAARTRGGAEIEEAIEPRQRFFDDLVTLLSRVAAEAPG